jgi:peptidylamidoglycolate lyase
MLTLGELFVPGDDHSHVCKPTDIVLSNDNLFVYIADGYCNSRILKFNSNGTFIRQYQIPQNEKQLVIPHSLILIESLDLICVADRQNGRLKNLSFVFYSKEFII